MTYSNLTGSELLDAAQREADLRDDYISRLLSALVEHFEAFDGLNADEAAYDADMVYVVRQELGEDVTAENFSDMIEQVVLRKFDKMVQEAGDDA